MQVVSKIPFVGILFKFAVDLSQFCRDNVKRKLAGMSVSGCEFVTDGFIEAARVSHEEKRVMSKPEKGAEPTNGLKRLEEKLKPEKPKNFPAYVRANFDRLSRVLDAGERGPEKWQTLTNWANEEDYTGGKKLTVAAVRRAYEREAARRRAKQKPVPPKPDADVSPVIKPPAQSPEGSASDAPKPGPGKADFLARMRSNMIGKKE